MGLSCKDLDQNPISRETQQGTESYRFLGAATKGRFAWILPVAERRRRKK